MWTRLANFSVAAVPIGIESNFQLDFFRACAIKKRLILDLVVHEKNIRGTTKCKLICFAKIYSW